MLSRTAGVPTPLVFISDNAGVAESWELLSIKALDGVVVGRDDAGAALSYPVAMTAIEGGGAWFSVPIAINAAGIYIAVFRETSNDIRVSRTVEVSGETASASSSASSSTSSNGSSASSGPAYITEADLIDRMTEKRLKALMLDKGEDEATVYAARLAKLMSDAEAEVDGYLSAVYDLPLTTVPRLVRRLTVDVAEYIIHQRRTLPNKGIVTSYEAASKLLEQISKRRIRLGVQPEPIQNPSTAAVLSEGTAVYDADGMGGW